MNHDVGAEFDGPKQDRRGDRIVDDQRHSVPVSNPRQGLDVANVSGWIADAFAEDCTRPVVYQALHGLRIVRSRKAHCYALAGQDMREQRISSAVKLDRKSTRLNSS